MKECAVIFPHQLFKNIDFIPENTTVFLVEEYLFFKQYPFHKQKLVFHRASMKYYANFLENKGLDVNYIESISEESDVRVLLQHIVKKAYDKIHVIDPTDNWLEKRIKENTKDIEVVWSENPLFINTREDLKHFFKPTKKKFFQTSFYKLERQRLDVLMVNNTPAGGKWTFDAENRKKYPKNKTAPCIQFPDETLYYKEAVAYVKKYFTNNYGSITNTPIYPISFEQSEEWFQQFLNIRFDEFGDYEDAVVKDEHYLNHSLLSPLLNVGLLSIGVVVDKTLKYAKKNGVPINSVEGFIRQLIGWREFIRGVYEVKGTEERTENFWKHSRKIPQSFYNGTTGITPIDNTIKKLLKTGYSHHIERLMLLGNFMNLCEFDPDAVHQWFMELYIDAYDWVMVPNVYGMTLYADGGLMSTKPYISSSNYVKKMSDYKNGDWQQVWDGLFWNFMDKNQDFFKTNPRLGMLLSNLNKMAPETKENHLKNAQQFLEKLDIELQ